jgi:hypothetical protein
MFGADPFGPRFNIVIRRDSHQSGYNLGSAGPLRHLAFGGAVTDFTTPIKVEGLFQGVMGLPFVQTHPRTAVHAGVHDPVDQEECSLNPTNLPQSNPL